MPEVGYLFAVIALVLYIVFGYLLPTPSTPSWPAWGRCALAWLITLIIVLIWYVIPVHVGGRG